MTDPQRMSGWDTLVAGDAVSHGVAGLLLLMSIVSWYFILSRGWFTWQASRSLGPALARFWQEADPSRALEGLRTTDRCGLLTPLANGLAQCSSPQERQRALREALGTSRRELQRGLTWLASVASTAPFVGLLGTVWGIYHALVGITASGQASIERVAGPVGEALIMTAAGLAVAIPALLAYNALVRTQREILLRIDGFAHDLQAQGLAGDRP
jgi:biopolymer transport protein ExbB